MISGIVQQKRCQLYMLTPFLLKLFAITTITKREHQAIKLTDHTHSHDDLATLSHFKLATSSKVLVVRCNQWRYPRWMGVMTDSVRPKADISTKALGSLSEKIWYTQPLSKASINHFWNMQEVRLSMR